MEKKTINDKICIFLLPVAWAFILLFCVLLFSSTSHAEETINPLPYYVNAEYSNYFHLTTQQLNLITSYTSTSDNQLFWLTDPFVIDSTHYATYLCSYKDTSNQFIYLKSGADLTTNVSYSMFDIDNDYIVISRSTGTFIKKYIVIDVQTNEFSFVNNILPDVRSYNLMHLSTKTINQFGFTPNVPFLLQGSNVTFGGNSEQIVFSFGQPVPPTPEDENITDETEKPTFSDYEVDWSSGRPSFDPSDPTQSLFSFFSWFASKIGDTLTGGWNFIVDSLDWSLQRFLNNVRAKFNEVKESVNDFADMVEDNVEIVQGYLSDLKDYVSDIKTDVEEFADLFIHPFDEEEFEDQMGNSEFLNAYDEFMANAEILNDIFDNAEERDHFSLYISFENPFADTNHRIISSEINFDWLVPLRSIYRPFLWVCTLVELFVGGARVLTHVLGGKGV